VYVSPFHFNRPVYLPPQHSSFSYFYLPLSAGKANGVFHVIDRSTERVPNHTSPEVNAEIRQKTLENVSKYAPGGPPVIQWRIDNLDREWDIERLLEANAATFSLIGLALAVLFSTWFLLLPFAVAAFLLQHALQGWCPPLPIFRRLGFRTRQEINYERYALKNLRGDFNELAPAPPEHTTPDRAEKVLAAVEK
jgi:hypothetical protein